LVVIFKRYRLSWRAQSHPESHLPHRFVVRSGAGTSLSLSQPKGWVSFA
jgi:hypothetical protein